MLMESALFLIFTAVVVGAIGLLALFLKSRFHEDNKVVDSSSSPPSLLPCKWTHDVFPSFHGEDVRIGFLSHIHKEFKSKGIISFIDNNIKRGESIGPELINAISSAKIAVVLISKKYASSKWCLDELMEIMKCKKELGQTVLVVFYKVDPSHVKKLTGNFGEVFKKTCVGKTKKDVKRWRQAFAEVATIAGYDSRNWDNEAFMIEEIVAEISKRLIVSAPSKYLDGLVGMEAHMENMKPLLCLGSNEARIIGIWGPPGIGKTTIARVIHDQYSRSFQLSAFIEIKPSYERPTCSDDYNAKLQLEQQLISQLINKKDIDISHVGAAQNLLVDKKTLIILDGVYQLVQLHVILKVQCLGLGTRIIITTQDQRLLKAFDVKYIYNVDFPPSEEALQIFCISAFGRNFPKDGFEDLAKEVTIRAGRLPLGLRVMGSHFRGMSKQEWEGELPRLRVHLDGEIGSILKFSYNALGPEDKVLFLYIACFFAEVGIYEAFEDVVKHRFSNVQQGLTVLSQRSLISDSYHMICPMHSLLVQLGREIVCNQSISKPGKRQFLVDAKEISEVLAYNTGSRSVIGITFDTSKIDEDLSISERAFEEMSNLELLRIHRGYKKRLLLEQGLKYLPPKLRILHWDYFPMTSLPCNFIPKFLVKIQMEYNNLEKLWDGIQPLKNLKFMNLNHSHNLKELPDLSTATNLLELKLAFCEHLVDINTIGNVTNLRILDLRECSSLVELPSSIRNAIHLKELDLFGCKSLVELPTSIGNLTNVKFFWLSGCSSLVELPFSIGNLTGLHDLDISGCSSLIKLPSSIGNLTKLEELNVSGCTNLVEIPSSIRSITNLMKLKLARCSSLVELPSSIGNVINLQELDLNGCSSLVEIPSSIGNLRMLTELSLKGCSKLEILPININLDSLEELDVTGCSQLTRFPEISTNIRRLMLCGTSIKEVPLSIKSWTRLQDLRTPYLKNIGEFPHALSVITNLEFYDTEMKEIPAWFNEISPLDRLTLIKCKKLNGKARNTIIQASSRDIILPGSKVPTFFTNRAINGGSLTVKVNNRICVPTFLRFKVCIMLANTSDKGVRDEESLSVLATIVDKQSGLDIVPHWLNGYQLRPLLTEHLYINEVCASVVKSSELSFEFKVESDQWEVVECGIRVLSKMDSHMYSE